MKIQTARTRTARAFSLLEVMFAVIALCTATFAILALVSQSLDNARRLQKSTVDAGLVAAELSLTNQLVEGEASGDLGDLLGDAYKDYTWAYNITEEQSNKLFRVVFNVQRSGINQPVLSKMTILLFRPQSPAGSLDGATVAR